MDFHKRAGLLYKLDKLQLGASHYKGHQRGRLTKEIKYLRNNVFGNFVYHIL